MGRDSVGSPAIAALVRLQAKVDTADGGVIPSPLKTRNGIAHGKEWTLLMPRTGVDAIKRAVAFGVGSPLAVVARLGSGA